MLEDIPEEVITEAYKDAAAPAAKSVGSALKDCVDAYRYRFTKGLQTDALEQRKLDRLKEAVDEIPAERLIPPHRVITAPAMEQYLLRDEGDRVGEAALNIVLAASDKSKLGKAHPAFSAKLAEMADEEILLLQQLAAPKHVDHNDLATEPLYITTDDYFLLEDTADHQFINHLELKSPPDTDLASEGVESPHVQKALLKLEELQFPQQIDIYIRHLHSLGYVSIEPIGFDDVEALRVLHDNRLSNREIYYINESINEALGDCVLFTGLLNVIRLTSLGKLFVEICY